MGVQDRKYLDATGLVRNRSIGDLMRYAILTEGLDTLAHFGDFQPSPGATVFSGEEGTRYSDEQLYALALYISSLKPPPNPNKSDEHARKGQVVFQRQGCVNCYTPIYARLRTFWISASELTHTLRSKHVEARGSTKCRHCKAFGSATHSAMAAKRTRWKNGSTLRG
jgi:hypothetical protein